MKAMEHPNGGIITDGKVGAISGLVVGFIKWFDIYLLTDSYSIVLLKVFITAVIGGLGGVVGKHLFTYLKKIYDKKFKKTNQP